MGTSPQTTAITTGLSFDDVFSNARCTLRGITSWDQVGKLGSNNIQALIASARGHEKSLTASIKRLKQKQELLRGKSGEDFQRMAGEYELPVISEVGVPSDSWSQDPKPLDVESKNREGGSTTFNICGWCEHASGGSCRYQYYITTRFGQLGSDTETAFNTPCLLHELSADYFDLMVNALEEEIQGVLNKREKVREGIKLLQRLKKGASSKPYLISLRPYDHFNVGDPVVVYIGGWKGESIVKEGVWVPAVTVFGYRHHKKMVSYQTQFPIHTHLSNFEGRGGAARLSRPEVLLASEFAYLRDAYSDDFEFVASWLANVDSDLKGFSRAEFGKALAQTPEFATPPADWTPPTEEIKVETVMDAERVLNCFSSDDFKTPESIRSYAAMQLKYVHPDRFHNASDEVKEYAARQTRAVYAACDLLIARLGNK